jgi:tRNA modification GTPase
MIGKLAGWNDTIVAPATALGVGAIAVIRLSGKEALDIAGRVFPSKQLREQPSHTLHVGYIKDGDERIDEVVVGLFKAPASFTGEDVVEISCHGSVHIQQVITQLLIRHGARAAKAGEFTQRAFLNGRLDLAQAESVADLIASNTEASRRNALQNMRGGFSSELKTLRDRLIRFSALIELELDFATEDVEFADRTQLHALLRECLQKVQALLQSFRLGNVIKNGVQVAIVGRPNAGKSTLLNALLQEERAIVSDIAGTTRDTIEETLNIGGILFRLIDTAGIREHTADVIESLGIQKSLDKMRQADIVVYLFDVATTTPPDLQQAVLQLADLQVPYLLVGNKADSELSAWQYKFAGQPVLFISAKAQQGLDQLSQSLYEKALADTAQPGDTIITNARHVDALQRALQALTDVQDGLAQQLPGDLLALDIRQALHYLGEITGEVSNEDRLDYIFSKFCIGK